MGKPELTEADETIIEAFFKNSKQNNSDQSWPEPEQIKAELLPVEKLPPEILPEPFRDWLRDVSFRMQVPLDIVTIGAMVTSGALIGSGCGIRPKLKDNWLVIPNLWGAGIDVPGSLKTAAFQEAIRPLNLLESSAKEKYDDELICYEIEKEAYKARREAIKAQMQASARGKGGATIDELKTQMMNLEKQVPPVWKRYITNDSTIEKMAELLEQNPQGILLFRDELVGLLSSWDREGREADRAFYLESWNGYGSITTDRIGRGTVHVDNLCVSILGGIQPAKLLAYLYQATSALENDGLIQRMQLMVYPDKHVNWKLVDEYPNQLARNRAYKTIKALAEMEFHEYGAEIQGERSIPYYHFSENAQEVFYEWLTELQEKIQVDDSPVMLEHLSKYRSLMPSLALIDHILNIADGQQPGPVTLESTEKAAAWCDYLESHARRIYALVGNIGQRAAVELSRKIKNKKLQDGFTVRDVYRNGWQLLDKKEAVKAACEELEEAGWLQLKLIPIEGRQAKTVYMINPKIYH